MPGVIEPIPVTDEDAPPVANELHERRLGAGGVYLEIGHRRIRHHPEPMPIAVQEPRGLVNVVHRSSPSHFTNGRIMREDRFRDAIDHLLDGPCAHWYPKERGAQVLHR